MSAIGLWFGRVLDFQREKPVVRHWYVFTLYFLFPQDLCKEEGKPKSSRLTIDTEITTMTKTGVLK